MVNRPCRMRTGDMDFSVLERVIIKNGARRLNCTKTQFLEKLIQNHLQNFIVYMRHNNKELLMQLMSEAFEMNTKGKNKFARSA